MREGETRPEGPDDSESANEGGGRVVHRIAEGRPGAEHSAHDDRRRIGVAAPGQHSDRKGAKDEHALDGSPRGDMPKPFDDPEGHRERSHGRIAPPMAEGPREQRPQPRGAHARRDGHALG